MDKIKEMRDQRLALVNEANEILNMDDKELTAEMTEKFEKLMAEADALEAKIKRHERMATANASIDAERDRTAYNTGQSTDEQEVNEERDRAIFQTFLRHGMSALNADERQIMASRRSPQQAQSIGTDTAGGHLVPTGFQRDLEQGMLSFGGIREACTVFPTETGNDLPWPTSDDTSNEGERVAENVQVNEQDVTVGQAMLNAYKYSSKMIRVPVELIQDSAFPIDSWLNGILAERIARITNREMTVGTGTGMPNGIVTASVVGPTSAASAAVAYDDVLALIHSVDPSYRNGGRFMFHDNVLLALRLLKDSQGHPLWQPGLVGGEPDRLLGFEYTINQHMEGTLATTNISMLFGQLKKYMVRDVRQTEIMVLRERYADFHQVAFLGFSRHDGELIDAGTNPVKHLVQV